MNPNQRIRIIYPDDRFVPVIRLIQWAEDAVANGDTTHQRPRNLAEVVTVLEDSGYVTFHCSISTFMETHAQAVHEPFNSDDDSAGLVGESYDDMPNSPGADIE